MAVGARSCLANSWRISHFGINPVRGGSPPKDSSTRGVKAVRAGVFVQEMARALMVVELLILKTMNVENVMIKYISRVRSVREGANCSTSIIQPRCAIEE